MAFVYQSERWDKSRPIQELGPGYYDAQIRPRPKCGIITPKPKPSCILRKQINNASSYQQNLIICPLIQLKEGVKNSPGKKVLRRVASACPGGFRRQTNQNCEFIDRKGQKSWLQIGNSNSSFKNQFNNSTIKTSFKISIKQVRPESQPQLNQKLLFNDKSMKTFQSNKLSNPSGQKQAFDLMSPIFVKSKQKNVNLAKFASNKKKTQNLFTSAGKPSNLPEYKQNFIIASQISKKQVVTYQSSMNKLGGSETNNKYLEFDDMQTTGIQDSQELSFQYIADATPGPGQYQLIKQRAFEKSKVQKFGVTVNRFKQKVQNALFSNLNIDVPILKKTSNASQQKVGFGKGRPGTATQLQSNAVFYEDHRTIENKSIKNLIKDRTAPGTFLTKCNRFLPKKTEEYNGPDFLQTNKHQAITLPDSIFMSKVERQQRPVSPTAQIDFEGQSYMTIQKKLEKFKASKQLLDAQQAGFQFSAPRFKYAPRQEKSQLAQRMRIKQQKGAKEIKSYTFKKQQFKNYETKNEVPAPWSYSTSSKWIKPSHHIRFKF